MAKSTNRSDKECPGSRRDYLSYMLYMVPVLVLAAFIIFDINPLEERVEVTKYVVTEPDMSQGFETVLGRSSDKATLSPDDWWGQSLMSSCEGAEQFYSGDGFLGDWKGMIEIYESRYSEKRDEVASMQKPLALFSNSSGYDCEDFAHASRCLADLYSSDCAFWVEEPIGRIIPDRAGHLGVCCEVSPKQYKCI